MTKNFLALIATSLFAASTLAGCALEGDACTADSDCEGGFKCVLPAPAADGTTEDGTCNTECTTNADCATGFDCNTAEATCVASTTPPPPDCTTDAQCAGGYACDADGGSCFTACTDATECKEDAQCTDGACETVTPVAFTQVAVLSELSATSTDVEDTNTPGPDIDSIELITAGTTLQAATVVTSVPGAIGDEGNAATTATTVTGARDAMTGNGPAYDCDVDSQTYLSLGANDGFVVVSFPGAAEITDGSQVKVWEIASQDCEQDIRARDDAYTVHIAPTGTTATTAAGIRAGGDWCAIGTQAGGGIGTFTVTLANCD